MIYKDKLQKILNLHNVLIVKLRLFFYTKHNFLDFLL